MRISLNAGGLGRASIAAFQADTASLIDKVDHLIIGFVAVKHQTRNLNGGAGQLQGALDSMQARINAETARRDAAIAAREKADGFLALAMRIDGQVAAAVQKNKEEFYQINPWLKPASDKPWHENAWNDICTLWDDTGDFLKKAWDGLMDFYNSSIGKIIIGVLVIAALAVATALTGGVAGVILGAALSGALAGGASGAIIGAGMAILSGKGWDGIFRGMAEGFLSGVIVGAISGAALSGINIGIGALTHGTKGVQIIGSAQKTQTLFHGMSSNMQAGKMAMQIGRYSKIGLNVPLNKVGLVGGRLPDAMGVARFGANKLVEVVSRSQTTTQMVGKCITMIGTNLGTGYTVISWTAPVSQKLFAWSPSIFAALLKFIP